MLHLPLGFNHLPSRNLECKQVVVAAFILILLSGLAVGAGASQPASLSVTFSDVNGRMHTPLSQPAKKATVFFFLQPDCPVSNAYAPEIKRICAEYEPKKIAAFVVHADPDVSIEHAKKHAKEYGLACPVLRDPTHVLVKRTGVTIAPEVAVLAPDGKILYRGRIDDLYVDYGKRRAEPTQRDLRNALEAVLQGKAVTTPATKAIGCPLPEPKK
jgi:thiol-disulfide isomerase/thioredoxin